MSTATLNIRVAPRRMLNAREAADYCGVPLKRFVADIDVRPVEMPSGQKLYDMHDLDRALDGLKHGAITLCANSDGRPWARGASGLRASWRPIRVRLEKAGKIRLGLTPKGLRHTVATILREMGKDERTIADFLGQKTPAMARHYSRRANLKRKNTATVTDFDAELNRRGTKSVKPA